LGAGSALTTVDLGTLRAGLRGAGAGGGSALFAGVGGSGSAGTGALRRSAGALGAAAGADAAPGAAAGAGGAGAALGGASSSEPVGPALSAATTSALAPTADTSPSATRPMTELQPRRLTGPKICRHAADRCAAGTIGAG